MSNKKEQPHGPYNERKRQPYLSPTDPEKFSLAERYGVLRAGLEVVLPPVVITGLHVWAPGSLN